MSTAWREGLVNRTYEALGKAEGLITQHSLVLIGDALDDERKAVDHTFQGVPTGRVRLRWEESPEWDLEVTLMGETSWLSLYDLNEGVTDYLAEWTAHFWETQPSILTPFTEDNTVETDRTYGMLDSAVFQLDKMRGAA